MVENDLPAMMGEQLPTEIETNISSEESKQDPEFSTNDERIRWLLRNETVCCDLLWNVFVAAARSYRFSSILRPFPPHFRNGDEKNIIALREAIKRIPPISSSAKSFWTSLPNECQDLLAWTLSVGQFHLKLRDRNSEFDAIRKLTGQIMETPVPHYVFEVIPNDEAQQKFDTLRAGRKTFYAYHGSRFDNFFSILHLGLNTHLNKVAVFGEGTYLSSELSVSLMYSQAGEGSLQCSLGSKLSCVAVCEMIDDPSVKCQIKEGSAASKKSRAQASKETDSVPEKYYVVQRNDVIRIKYLLVYKENSSQPQSAPASTSMSLLREYKFPLLMLAYILLLVAIGLANSRSTAKYITNFFKSLTS